jgi:hypothetical protein
MDASCREARTGLDRVRTSPTGYFTKRLAEDWLRDLLDEARRGTLPGIVRTGATFADAAAEFLRYAELSLRRRLHRASPLPARGTPHPLYAEHARKLAHRPVSTLSKVGSSYDAQAFVAPRTTFPADG